MGLPVQGRDEKQQSCHAEPRPLDAGTVLLGLDQLAGAGLVAFADPGDAARARAALDGKAFDEIAKLNATLEARVEARTLAASLLGEGVTVTPSGGLFLIGGWLGEILAGQQRGLLFTFILIATPAAAQKPTDNELNINSFNDITDKMSRGIAKKAFMAAKRAEKDATGIVFSISNLTTCSEDSPPLS